MWPLVAELNSATLLSSVASMQQVIIGKSPHLTHVIVRGRPTILPARKLQLPFFHLLGVTQSNIDTGSTTPEVDTLQTVVLSRVHSDNMHKTTRIIKCQQKNMSTQKYI